MLLLTLLVCLDSCVVIQGSCMKEMPFLKMAGKKIGSA